MPDKNIASSPTAVIINKWLKVDRGFKKTSRNTFQNTLGK